MAKATLKNVAFIGTQPERCWVSRGETPHAQSIAEIGRGGVVVAALEEREFVFHQFEIQRDLTQEQLAESVEIKLFQDAGLNPMLEYKNAFIRRPSRQDKRMSTVGVIASSMGALEGATAALRDQNPHIDAVVPLTTLPYALYNAEILEKKRDVFIYFQKDALLISLFDEGEFVYGKSQDNGLRKLLEEYATLSRDRMEFADFIRLLLTASPGREDPAQNAQVLADLREVISNVLFSIKNILLYAGRISGLSEFDRVFVGTCEGVIPGLDELAQEILEIEAHELIFYTPFFMEGESYVDQMAVLALLEASNLAVGLKPNPFNVTPYRRPGAFLKRPGGRLGLWMAASVAAALLWPGFYWGQTAWFEYQAQKGLAELGKSRAEFEALQERRRVLIEERDNQQKRFKEAEDSFASSMALLKAVHDKRVLSSPVATSLADLFSTLASESVFVEKLSLQGRDANLSLASAQDTRITDLVEKLVLKRYSPELERIEHRETTGRYATDLKVRLP